MEFINFGTKAVRTDKIEGVTLYRNEVTIYTTHHGYTCYYDTDEKAGQVYKTILEKLTGGS